VSRNSVFVSSKFGNILAELKEGGVFFSRMEADVVKTVFSSALPDSVTARVVSGNQQDNFNKLQPIPDFDGDGFDELAVFTTGSLHILTSSESYSFSDKLSLAVPAGNYFVGGRGDYDEDGIGDFWLLKFIPRSASMAFFVRGGDMKKVYGRGDSSLGIEDVSFLRMEGDREYTEAGVAGSMSFRAGDVDGDGIPDFTVSDHFALNRSGAYFILPGSVVRGEKGTIRTSDERILKVRAEIFSFIGVPNQHVDNFDFDKDGYDDLFITADSDTEAGIEAGSVYVLSGKKIIEKYSRIRDGKPD
jgi:hypothetical protein